MFVWVPPFWFRDPLVLVGCVVCGGPVLPVGCAWRGAVGFLVCAVWGLLCPCPSLSARSPLASVLLFGCCLVCPCLARCPCRCVRTPLLPLFLLNSCLLLRLCGLLFVPWLGSLVMRTLTMCLSPKLPLVVITRVTLLWKPCCHPLVSKISAYRPLWSVESDLALLPRTTMFTPLLLALLTGISVSSVILVLFFGLWPMAYVGLMSGIMAGCILFVSQEDF